MNKQFSKDVLDGLNATPKSLPSKYFYDQKGDALFQQIMELDEYYLTRCEFEVLENNKDKLLQTFSVGVDSFNLIEFGAGDGHKTKLLLKHFVEKAVNFNYVPIDISGNVLQQLESSLKKELPDLHVRPVQNDYFKALGSLENGAARNIVLFLGSNIGNFRHDQAVSFLRKMNSNLKKGDLVLIGFDLKKDPDIILKAYNDSKGITKAFNMNLLDRINHELGANFDTSKFIHYPVYNPLTGATQSFLVSTEAQTVEIMDSAIQFEAWEAIHTEVSQKYALKDIEDMAAESEFDLVKNFFDGRRFYTDSVWRK